MYATPEPTAFLLNALLPGADAAADEAAKSHISDFRQQPRSDSRADKPDLFPGFDAAGEVRSAATAALPSSSSASLFRHQQQHQPQQPEQHRRPTRTEFYAQLVAKLIGNIGVDNIIGSVERKHDKLQRLRRLKQLKAHIIASAVHGNRAVPEASERPLVPNPLVDDVYADYDDDDDAAVESGVVQVVATAEMPNKSKANVRMMLSPTTPSASPPPTTSSLRDALHALRVPAVFAIPAAYVSSLWTNYMLPNQLRNTFGLADQSDGGGNSNQSGGAATKQHSHEDAPDVAHKNATLTTLATPKPVAPGGADATLNRLLLSPLRDIWHSATKNWYVNHPNPNTTLLHIARTTDAEQRRRSHGRQQQQHQQHASANDTGINVRHPDGMRNRQSTATPSSIDDTSSSINGTNSTGTRLARAKLAFLHAFYKYSKHMSNGNYTDSNKNNGSSSSSITAAHRHGHGHGQQQYATAKTTAAASLVNTADANVFAAAASSDAAAALPSTATSTTTTTGTADEFDANLNINDNVVAVGLAAERIAQLYGYRVPATAATAVHNHRVRAQTTSAVTTAEADATNQHVVERQQRLRRVGERFIALGARGRRRVTAQRTKDVEDDDDGGDEADEGDDDDNNNEHNASSGSTSSNGGGGGMAAGEIAESVGIFVLEILGTIVGLGWGAITYLQSLIYA